MTNGSELKSPAAMALRSAGFLPLPRWWVTKEQMELIAWMVKQNGDVVNQIRADANRRESKVKELTKEEQMDLDWKLSRKSDG